MKSNIKLAIIGATGKSGSYLRERVLLNGFYCKLLIRTSNTFETTSPLIQIVRGDARNFDDVDHLLQGCDAVMSTLGQPRGESAIFSQATANVIRAMTKHNIQRYTVITGLNVDTPEDSKGPKTKMATEWMKLNYPETTADKQLELEILMRSRIDWTLVRLPMIKLSDQTGEIMVDLHDCPGESVRSADLANFLVAQLFDPTYFRKAPFLASL